MDIKSIDRCENPMSHIMDQIIDKSKRCSNFIEDGNSDIGELDNSFKEYKEGESYKESYNDKIEKTIENILNESSA